MFKKIFIRFLVLLLVLQGAIIAETMNISRAYAAGETVVINEVMWMGSAASTADEWIELRNTTSDAIDLSGWQLTHAAPSNGTLTIPAGNSIEGNGYFLISNYDLNHENSVLNVASDWVTTSVSLSNTCQAGSSVYMELQNPFPTDPPTVIDQAGCDGSGGSPLKGSNLAIKKAMERNIVITDGLLETSWHDSASQINLDLGAIDNASPRANNDSDVTAPLGGIVNDGTGVDIDWSNNLTSISMNWSGFVDPESGVARYEAGLGLTTSTADVVGFTDVGSVTATTLNFSAISGVKYYSLVRATNGAGLTGSVAASDGFTVDIAVPQPPTNLAVTDVPSDNGGAVNASWDASVSLDVTNYELNYREVGEVDWTPLNTALLTSAVVNGLNNVPATYEFKAVAIDFSGLESAPVGPVNGQALDNLAPILILTKIKTNQNKPGTVDTVYGLSGAVSETSTINVLDRNPADPGVILLGSVASNPDGSFPAVSIGDNLYGVVNVQAIDAGNNSSSAVQAFNDTVGPNSATLQKIAASCPNQFCRTTISWGLGSADSAYYQVGYRAEGGIETKTFDLTATTVRLDLPVGHTYEFAVYAFDKYGNPASKSNVFTLALVEGVNVTAGWVNGHQVTQTSAIDGAREVIEAPPATAKAVLVPKAHAAETPSPEDPAKPQPTKVDATNSQDWPRVFVVVVLLLVIAATFYALSRSLQPTAEESFDQTRGRTKPVTAKRSGRRKRRR
ncbi:hypothetical protein A3A71_04115 [Candidatus Berkelbacteria bacterium RIFCSPLOWO2_01_FULL_50_28]|uniref:LTD domain-containing protein n=1 Tax=Candidatus Berkelbacteria bacterium RIFCSPLOWO2_01_FULL_50_28 TaxID=1797471 RepID=A0A1F5EAI4_9BACT|nr:MAG: hypothetical protein A2807_03495 [Candidatus Berkelbacteria bacterium RIFCSPHIGHO2_01_FULL_50_36]OGD62462.1 MAG: hypothetical protein A3F39_02030 [Candidatus Berkelbacteria bacterium RIFCSPHIGHO2_12_FULL_50_11]OGD64320.1 MAG: hypothetical protein A3A71_04115 [Candidatus Berkelbacteria bacterium RIFCSPLOWO2_01_FULL_50_28]